MLKDLVDGGSGPRVERHRPVQDIHDLRRHLREHLLEALLLPALHAPKVLLGVFVGEELHFGRRGFAEGGEDHGELVVAALGVAVCMEE